MKKNVNEKFESNSKNMVEVMNGSQEESESIRKGYRITNLIQIT